MTKVFVTVVPKHLVRSLRFLHFPAPAVCEDAKIKKAVFCVAVWKALIQFGLFGRLRTG
jgi:hypothetical protein